MKTIFMMRSRSDGPVLRCFILEGLVLENSRNRIRKAAERSGLSTEVLVVSECRNLQDIFEALADYGT